MLLAQPGSKVAAVPEVEHDESIAAHWRDFARQHADTLQGQCTDLPNVSIFRGQFVTLYVVKTPDPLELTDPGVGCEIFLLNATHVGSIPLAPNTLGMRAVRAFGPEGELLSDEVITFPQAQLSVPVGGFVRIA